MFMLERYMHYMMTLNCKGYVFNVYLFPRSFMRVSLCISFNVFVIITQYKDNVWCHSFMILSFKFCDFLIPSAHLVDYRLK